MIDLGFIAVMSLVSYTVGFLAGWRCANIWHGRE